MTPEPWFKDHPHLYDEVKDRSEQLQHELKAMHTLEADQREKQIILDACAYLTVLGSATLQQNGTPEELAQVQEAMSWLLPLLIAIDEDMQEDPADA